MLSLDKQFFRRLHPLLRRHGLAPRLILYILLFSSVVTFFATAIQLYFDYSRDVQDIKTRMSQVRDSYLNSIVLSLWSMDYAQLQSQLEGIQALPDMQYLEVELNNKTILSVGNMNGHDLLRKSYPLTYLYRNQNVYLGTLHVAASLDGVYERLRDRVLVIFGSQAIKTFLVTSFMFLLFQFLVTRHLQKISNYLRSRKFSSPAESPQPLILNRNTTTDKRRDELDDVVKSFNEMYTDLTNSYKQLAKSEDRLDLAMRGANDGLWDWDIQAGETYYSSRWKNMLGYDDDELEATIHTWLDRIHPDDFNRTIDVLQLHLDRFTRQFECIFRIRHKDGSYKWVLSRGQALWSTEGIPHRIVGTHVDITAQKEAEAALDEATRAYKKEQEQRINAERLACVGELAASIAHEIRNPLSSIINSLTLLTHGPLDTSDRNDVIDIVNDETHRLQRILNDFLSFSRLPLPDIHTNNIISVLIETTTVLRLSIPDNCSIELVTIFHTRTCLALFDKDQLSQVILNVGLNAIQSMPNGGSLTLTTTEYNDRVIISITDTGNGFDEDMQEIIIKPFYTSRENGTGLGLSIVTRILAQHNSELLIDSLPGSGTTMKFSLKKA